MYNVIKELLVILSIALIFVGIIVFASFKMRPEQSIRHLLSKGESGAVLSIDHNRGWKLNDAFIEVYQKNKIKIVYGNDTYIIPISNKDIEIISIEPIHKVYSEFLGGSTKTDSIIEYTIQIRY